MNERKRFERSPRWPVKKSNYFENRAPKPVPSLNLNTPDVPIEKRQKQGFDFNSYDANTMQVDVDVCGNSNYQTLDAFLATLYARAGIGGKTPVLTTTADIINQTID